MSVPFESPSGLGAPRASWAPGGPGVPGGPGGPSAPPRLDEAAALAAALMHTRRRTLGLIEAWCEALPSLEVPQRPTLNPPLWEWGHVAWFQAWWIGRNRQRHRGVRADPDHERMPSRLPAADALYDSSRVAHADRWSLPLPDLVATRSELARTLDETLELLERDAAAGADLYFWHLVRAHEDMHNEASVYMAQALGLPLPPPWATGHDRAPAALGPRVGLSVPAGTVTLGHEGPGFCFDNELGAHVVSLSAFEIDATPVSWGDYLAFIDETGHPPPSHLRRESGRWWQRRFDHWAPVPSDEAACHLTADDAQAWCAWAGRALPTEAQWEAAARRASSEPGWGFRWGQVWEWTASTFQPYPGFEPHPYRDYSAPWFGTHRVLRGASLHTEAHLVSLSYRNFFLPHRSDVPAGFRTVAPVMGG